MMAQNDQEKIFISDTKKYDLINNGPNTDPITFDNPNRPSLAYPDSLGCLFIFTTLLIGVLIRAIMLWTSLCIPYRVIMFSLGGIAGFCANRYPTFKPLVSICYIDVDIILLSFLPTLIFSTSYSVDSHSFWKSLPQILLVGVPGALLTAVIAAFMAYYLIESSWNFATSILFGVVCSPIYPLEVVKKLKEMSKGKNISVLLLGEGLVGDVTVMIEFTAIFGYLALAISSASQISLLLLRYAGGGLLLGVMMGNIFSIILSITYFDLLSAVLVTLSGAYLTYYIGEKFLYVSGLLGTLIAGVLMSDKKSTVSGDVEQVVSNFWNIMAHIANTLVFTMVGVVIFEKVSYVFSVRQVSLIFVTYTTVYCSRLMVYAAMTPLLRYCGYGMTWEHCMACVWGGLRGPLSLCLALIVLETPSVADAGEIFIIQTAGLTLLSLLINATTMHKVLKILGLTEISLAKKANMTNCVKRIMMTRDRCVSMLKMDKFLADANWDMVQQGTSIKHPYQLQISGRDEDSDDDTYMGYHYTTCPDCEREIPNEPTKKEYAEMLRYFYIIYVLEMIIKMFALGVKGYFKCNWNKLDFFIIAMATGDLVLDIIDALTPWDKWKNLNSSVLTATKLLRMLRFLRLCKLARVSVPKIMAYIDRMIDVQLAFGYDVGKGFVTGEQEVCSLLPQLVDNKQIQEILYNKLEADRLAVTRQLGLLQRDRPWTAITVKTRQATTSTLNIMMLDANQLKEEGFLDEMEYRLLVHAIQERVQKCRHKGSLVAPSAPETQLRAVSWLQGNERVAEFFLENSDILNYNYNDILISRGDEPKGLYVLVSGMVEATYFPPEEDMDDAIPNCEFLTDLKYHEPASDYIVSGNAVGVLGILTNRPYSYTVRCESAVQAYYITLPILKEAFNLAPHPILGLEAAMWREIGIKLAMMVLSTVPAYHSWSAEKLSMRLEHSFVPCLKAFKVFVVNELMEDIVLLDGICQDMATREIFQPPCYIPRTAHRLVFPKSSQLIVTSSCPETKLLIIPSKDADLVDIMEDELDDTQCELVSNVSSRCFYHKIARKLSSDTRAAGRRGRTKRRRQKRVNYRDSVWGKQASTPMLAGAATSEKEISSKYYKPSLVDMQPEKLESDRYRDIKRVIASSSILTPIASSQPRVESEEELYNTTLLKNKSYERRRRNDN